MQEPMVRVQNYFPAELLNELRAIARKEEESLAEVIRKAARSLVARSLKKPTAKSGAALLIDSLKKISFKAEKDLSLKIDQYLYAR